MFTNILEYKIFNKGKEDLIVETMTRDKVSVVSGNPEILYNGLNDEFLKKNFMNEHTIIIPDGVGTVIASKIVKHPVKEKIAGIDVMKEIIKNSAKEKKPVYFLGSKQEVVEKCVENIKKEYPNLKVSGYHDGYFDVDNCSDIVDEIIASKPWAIFVAMGSPKQENFIYNNFDKIPASVFMGVGGSFDIFAGNLKRAPKWMIKLGLEWLYRVVKEPFRIKRLWVIPKFLWIVFKNRNNGER
ncbi:WecB/TagA/CpsF family glycosyltransferase [Clostridium sp. MSJ-8]|uniref:WecB/TagA/CpsF family glycosyltransferase n=1 Tax=Clostridium sp. MSJ-8 TaxID=2841510 RepID=UPI001C0EF8F4|nr:WecB/TagA/CpsF family glycosyltransferase [Clostridium sp. MSJ-8]MBU5487580.1 WecB/TagA/CpsF family glycosyltransferase [Clostridium sp. MSJ-8]